jgi:inosose dehydratase
VLDEMSATGYRGTELGDWGFMPSDPALLAPALSRRGLQLVGGFVPVALSQPGAWPEGQDRALRTARLLAAVGGEQARLVLADANGTDPLRTAHAGRVTPAMALDEARWQRFAEGTERIARAVREQTGLVTAFHHHCGGYVETPAEIARLMAMTGRTSSGYAWIPGTACGEAATLWIC